MQRPTLPFLASALALTALVPAQTMVGMTDNGEIIEFLVPTGQVIDQLDGNGIQSMRGANQFDADRVMVTQSIFSRAFKLDVATGHFSDMVTTSRPLVTLAREPVTGRFFGLTAAGSLRRVNVDTGATPRIGDTGLNAVVDLAFTHDRRLWLWVNNFTSPTHGLYELDPSNGAVLQHFAIAGVNFFQWIAADGNGDLLAGSGGSVDRVDTSTGTVTHVATVDGSPNLTTVTRFRHEIGLGYCSPAVPNSSGAPARIRALGSEWVAFPDLTLECTDLPSGTLGYVLVSRLSSVVLNPGGSQGTLCLGPPIGREIGDVQSSSASGATTFVIDPRALAQPTGPVAAQVGETWRFQCWFRDANPTSTSNFTDGVEIAFR